MNSHKPGKIPGESIKKIVEALCLPQSYEKVFYRDRHDVPMPSIRLLGEVMELLRSILFPGYFGNSDLDPSNMEYYIGAAVDSVAALLTEQIMSGFCVTCFQAESAYCSECQNKAHECIEQFLLSLPGIRHQLATDVEAAFNGDPAAKSKNETIYCYPSIRALTSYRISHRLNELGVPLIPRIISEMAHSETGIDIHPGAQIGEYCFIDHGTGTVIGETAIIGKNVRLYQGVTLGAVSFPSDDKGNPIKGIPRHPIVEDDVIIYAGSTILGRVTIGKGSEIGGNVWLTKDVPPHTRVVQRQPKKIFIQDKNRDIIESP
ncbi:MAG: serine acetyltransferase [Acidobacteria bacterium]|jgi:serine O-acetyltransferase|nr:serine acetyltransferase [Acidobacteriota bacterium]